VQIETSPSHNKPHPAIPNAEPGGGPQLSSMTSSFYRKASIEN
jgi:hypothetical protein